MTLKTGSSGGVLEGECGSHMGEIVSSLNLEALAKQVNGSLAGEAELVGQQSVMQSEGALPLSRLMLNHFQEPARSLESALDFYSTDFWTQNGDQRVNKLPFMSAGPWKLLISTCFYLYLVKALLPRFMRNRKPLDLNWLIRIYNLGMVLANLYGFSQACRILSFGFKCFGCQVLDQQDDSASQIELLHYGWIFIMSRLVEWLDTIFFVLRKKERQVTKLHVFHHSFVPIMCWMYLKFYPSTTLAFFPFVNSFVHTIMYAYYFLATFGSSIQPYLWWKKYLTSLQIAQFVLIILQVMSIPLSSSEECRFPARVLVSTLSGALLFLWLFYTFYLDTYRKVGETSSRGSLLKGCSAGELKGDTKRIKRRQREGTSRALAESVDNAIVCEFESTGSRGLA